VAIAAKWTLIGSLCATILEFLFPGPRQSWFSRVRGALFWGLYILIGTSLVLLTSRLLRIGSIQPLVHLDFSQSVRSGNWAVVVLALTVLPFVGMLVSDCFYYWFHRLQHATVLWRFHSLHHSITELNAFNNYHHVLEDIARIPFIVIPLLLVKVDSRYIPIYFFVTAIAGQLTHANSSVSYGPLRYVWAEPRFHRIHHSIEPHHQNKNFASFFPFLDVVFGTAYFPKQSEFPATGLSTAAEPKTAAQYLLWWKR
jgi:sterol desaturase/sphingolipid hydroxylase (fatty acid hydroxylase superfamily)